MAARETSFIDGIHRQLKKHAPAVRCVKFALRFVNGWPDAGYFAPNGNLLWVEYKVHPNNLTPQQKKTIDELRSHKQKVAIITLRDSFAIIDDGNELTQITRTKTHEWILNALNQTPECPTTPLRLSDLLGPGSEAN